MNTLSEYGFQYLQMEDKELFDPYYNEMNDNWASSVSFASMVAWNTSIKIYYKIIGRYICCLAQDTTCSRWVILPLIGHYELEALEESISELMLILEGLKIPPVFTDVSEWMLPYYEKLKTIKLKASYDVSLSDYIYQAEDFLCSLNNQSNRYDYNYFIKKNNPELVIMEKENIQSYMQFLNQEWCEEHSCDFCQYGCLLDSAKNIMTAIEAVGAKGICIYIDKKMVGYTIVTMERDQLIFHFKKGIHRYRGLSEYMHRKCLELFGPDAKLINYTEDINVEGLRKYKQKLAKYELRHKYELNSFEPEEIV